MQPERIAQPWFGTVRRCDVCGTRFQLRWRSTQKFCCRACAATTNTGPRNKTSRPWQERFWSFVPDRPSDGCWLWVGSRDAHGYGRMTRGRRGSGHIKAHQASYILHKGSLPAGRIVCHRCDNPSCVNPAHLYAGTHKSNAQDAVRRLRDNPVYGDANGRTTIPDAHVRAIRAAAASGQSYAEIALATGIRKKYVETLVRGERRRAAGGPIRGEEAA